MQMRWSGQEISNEAGDPAALPGLDQLHTLVRSVRTPEFAGITFHEVLAKSALNRIPKAAHLPFNWTVNPYRGCSHGCVYYPEVPGTGNDHGLGQIARLMATASAKLSHIPWHARDGWLRGQRWETWLVSVWPARPRVVVSNVITPRSSADLKRPPLVVVLHSPFVAADYTEQISHGSPSSTSVWMALTLPGSGRPVA